MKFSPTEFHDFLVTKGADARNISIRNWEVKVVLGKDKYTVWPTTGKWRKDKDGTIFYNLEEFIKLVEEAGIKEYKPQAPNELMSLKRTATWKEPFELAKYSESLERRCIMNCIGDLLQEVPRGGNVQFTVSPVECRELNADGRTLIVTVQAQYFKPMEEEENE